MKIEIPQNRPFWVMIVLGLIVGGLILFEATDSNAVKWWLCGHVLFIIHLGLAAPHYFYTKGDFRFIHMAAGLLFAWLGPAFIVLLLADAWCRRQEKIKQEEIIRVTQAFLS